MPLDPQDIEAPFFAVLKSGSAGAAVRALLGNDAASVIDADDLGAASLPTAPFVVLRRGPLTGAHLQLRTLFVAWWLYDDASRRYDRLNEIVALITAAYPRTTAIPFCHVELVDLNKQRDKALGNRPTIPMRFTVRTRR